LQVYDSACNHLRWFAECPVGLAAMNEILSLSAGKPARGIVTTGITVLTMSAVNILRRRSVLS
jgi:hypothetical protein